MYVGMPFVVALVKDIVTPVGMGVGLVELQQEKKNETDKWEEFLFKLLHCKQLNRKLFFQEIKKRASK